MRKNNLHRLSAFLSMTTEKKVNYVLVTQSMFVSATGLSPKIVLILGLTLISNKYKTSDENMNTYVLQVELQLDCEWINTCTCSPLSVCARLNYFCSWKLRQLMMNSFVTSQPKTEYAQFILLRRKDSGMPPHGMYSHPYYEMILWLVMRIEFIKSIDILNQSFSNFRDM